MRHVSATSRTLGPVDGCNCGHQLVIDGCRNSVNRPSGGCGPEFGLWTSLGFDGARLWDGGVGLLHLVCHRRLGQDFCLKVRVVFWWEGRMDVDELFRPALGVRPHLWDCAAPSVQSSDVDDLTAEGWSMCSLSSKCLLDFLHFWVDVQISSKHQNVPRSYFRTQRGHLGLFKFHRSKPHLNNMISFPSLEIMVYDSCACVEFVDAQTWSQQDPGWPRATRTNAPAPSGSSSSCGWCAPFESSRPLRGFLWWQHKGIDAEVVELYVLIVIVVVVVVVVVVVILGFLDPGVIEWFSYDSKVEGGGNLRKFMGKGWAKGLIWIIRFWTSSAFTVLVWSQIWWHGLVLRFGNSGTKQVGTHMFVTHYITYELHDMFVRCTLEMSQNCGVPHFVRVPLLREIQMKTTHFVSWSSILRPMCRRVIYIFAALMGGFFEAPFSEVALFRQLRLLVSTCVASIGALFWSMVLLFMLKIGFALIICQALQGYILDDNAPLDTRLEMNNLYGSFSKSLYTVFEITHSGSWPSKVRPVIEKVDGWYALPFLAYITLVVFAVIRIVP